MALRIRFRSISLEHSQRTVDAELKLEIEVEPLEMIRSLTTKSKGSS